MYITTITAPKTKTSAIFKFKFNNKPRKCLDCGAEFIPKSANQKFCQKCRTKRCPSRGYNAD